MEAHNNPDCALSISPETTSGSRWGDPHQPGNSGVLVSPSSGETPDGRKDRRCRKKAKTDRKKAESDEENERRKGGKRRTGRRGQESYGGSRIDGLVTNAFEGAMQRATREGRPSLLGGVSGLMSGPEGIDQVLVKGVESMGMKTVGLFGIESCSLRCCSLLTRTPL